MPPKVGGAMEKVKAGKGSNRKKRKKKLEPPKIDPLSVTEVDKTFYELQIADIHRKITRMRTLMNEYEEKNDELSKENEQKDEDTAEVISYLKRSLEEKENEVQSLHERLKAMHETKVEETKQYQEKIKQKEEEFAEKHEQLTSEAKVFQGKLNTLEEFRVQREELVQLYEEQEKFMEEQEVKHKREIYEIERKFIIGKDKLKKEMEARLLQLSTDFQDSTEVRIAATTHRVIRENIAINNELGLLRDNEKRLLTENENLKQQNRIYRLQIKVHEVEKTKAIRKIKIQTAIIERLMREHAIMQSKVNNLKIIEEEKKKQARELVEFGKIITNLELKIRMLEQNLHATRCECGMMQTDVDYYTSETNRLFEILGKAEVLIKNAMEITSSQENKSEMHVRTLRKNLLDNLLELLSTGQLKVLKKPTSESVESLAKTYFKGELDFVPKKQSLKYKYDVRQDEVVQVGPSFERFVTKQSEKESHEGEEGSDAELRIISDPEMLRLILKERQMKKEAEKKEEVEGIEEEIESCTLFDVVEVSEEESKEDIINPMDLDFQLLTSKIGMVQAEEVQSEDNMNEEEVTEENLNEEAEDIPQPLGAKTEEDRAQEEQEEE